ncbi:MAG: hypothetical protein ABFQ95_01065 [Pseudomonadota bacterium]
MSDEQEAVAEAETTQEAPQAQETQTEEPKEEKKQVPLDALQAERKKRQDAEYQAKWYQQQMAAFQQKQTQPEADDEDEYTKQIKSELRQELRQDYQNRVEKQYLANNPQAAEAIEAHLQSILTSKPHLSYSIQYAENRYEAAMDIIEKYSPKAASDSVKKKIEQSQKMPGSPASTGKSGGVGKSEMLDRMKKNKKEFSQYRAQLRGTSPNIR